MQLTPEQIVRKSRSNLAFALACLPRARREAMYVFYAFCRVIDDIADDPGWTIEQRREGLNRWRDVVTGAAADLTSFELQVRQVMSDHSVPAEEMLEIITGMDMDLEPRRFASWDELSVYCYRVASCVGLVSIRIFGCTRPESRDYAIHLGYALQITNILRDIRADWENDHRLYLPLDALASCGVTEDDIAESRCDVRMVKAIRTVIALARQHYENARACLTEQDRLPLLAAETMRCIYSETLELIEKDHARRIFQIRYRLSNFRKGAILLSAIIRGQWWRMMGG